MNLLYNYSSPYFPLLLCISKWYATNKIMFFLVKDLTLNLYWPKERCNVCVRVHNIQWTFPKSWKKPTKKLFANLYYRNPARRRGLKGGISLNDDIYMLILYKFVFKKIRRGWAVHSKLFFLCISLIKRNVCLKKIATCHYWQ